MDDTAIQRLGHWLRDALQARALRIDEIVPLNGGAIQENLSLRVDVVDGTWQGRHHWVLRRDAPASIAESHSRIAEHALLVAAHRAGVCVPRPIVACADADVIGTPFSVMVFRPGVGYGPKLVKDRSLGGDRERLVERLGQELAAIHAIDLRHAGLDVLGPGPADPSDPAGGELQRVRDGLDGLGAARPGLERALRIAAATRPDAHEITLVHRDFRSGNLLVDEHGLSAVLDWEFAGPGDPMSDLGWFCARCWRFSRPDLEAGGLGRRDTLYRSYEAASGRTVDDASVRWWELFAHLRWAMIALQQGARHASGDEPSLALALTGRMADTLERDALGMALSSIDGAHDERPVDSRGPTAGASPGTFTPLPDAHLLPSVARVLVPLIGTLAGEQAMTLRLAVRALRVAGRDAATHEAIERDRRSLLERAGAHDMTTLARGIRTGRYEPGAVLDGALLELCERVAASLDD